MRRNLIFPLLLASTLLMIFFTTSNADAACPPPWPATTQSLLYGYQPVSGEPGCYFTQYAHYNISCVNDQIQYSQASFSYGAKTCQTPDGAPEGHGPDDICGTCILYKDAGGTTNSGCVNEGLCNIRGTYENILFSQWTNDHCPCPGGGSPPPQQPPVTGVCGATHNICLAGNLGGTAEYPTAAYPNLYEWHWWCNGTNGGGNVLCSEQKPLASPSCSVSGPTTVSQNTAVQYCVSASNAPGGAEIWKSLEAYQNWERPAVRDRSVPGCGPTSFSQPGTYYITCNAYGPNSGNPKCSGNPFGLPAGWNDCGANDVLRVTVNPPGSSVLLKINGMPTYTYVNYNDKATLEWTSSNTVPPCTGSNDTNNIWTGVMPIQGSDLTSNITEKTIFSITCPNTSGNSVTSRVIAFVPPPPTSPRFSCGPGGTSATIFWNRYLYLGTNEQYLRVRRPDGSVYFDSNNFTDSSYTLVSIEPGQNYNWWVHSKAPNGAFSQAIGGTVNCPASAPPTPPTPPSGCAGGCPPNTKSCEDGDGNSTWHEVPSCTPSQKCECERVDISQDGRCNNDAEGKVYCQRPSGNLCMGNREATSPVPSADGKRWEWKCKGENGGSDSAPCEAEKSCAYREVVPN